MEVISKDIIVLDNGLEFLTPQDALNWLISAISKRITSPMSNVADLIIEYKELRDMILEGEG